MKLEVTGLDEVMRMLETAPDALEEAVAQKAAGLAEKVAGAARNGALVRDGRLRNAIESSFGDEIGAFVERPKPGTITGGARSSYPPVIYHEFGTGPVGAASGHPKAGELGITYHPTGWTYYSEGAIGQPLPKNIRFGPHKGEARKPEGQVNTTGLVYTEGVPARAFLYNAITALEDEITEALGDVVIEEILK